MMKTRKGQSAIEYLTTYGWMLLFVGIVGSLIFGIVQSRTQQSSVTGLENSDITVEEFGITESGLAMELRSTATDEVSDVNLSLSQRESGCGLVYAGSEPTIPFGETSTVEIPKIGEASTTNQFDIQITYNSGDLEGLLVNGTLTGNFNQTTC